MPLDPVPTLDVVDLIDPTESLGVPDGGDDAVATAPLDPDVVLAAVLARSAARLTLSDRAHRLIDRLRSVLPFPAPGDAWDADDGAHTVGHRVGRHRPAVVVLVVAVVGVLMLIGISRSHDEANPARGAIDDQLPRAGTAPSGVGAGEDVGGRPDPSGRSTPSGTAPSTAGDVESEAPPVLWVHAAGAVKAPGLYRVAEGARVADLLTAAGGAADDADTDRINLAAPLADAMRVYVPHKGEQAPPAVVGTSGPDATGSGMGAGVGAVPVTGGGGVAGPAVPIDLNSATAAQLDTLPGVGPATAASIIAWRTEHGRFSSVDDLLQVRGIGPSRMEQLRPLVSVS